MISTALFAQAEDSGRLLAVVSGWLATHPIAAQVMGLALVAVLAYLVDKVARRRIAATLNRIVTRSRFTWDDALERNNVFQRLAHIAPAIVVYYGIQFVPGLGGELEGLVQRVSVAYMFFVVVMSAGAFLSAVNDAYSMRPEAADRPIKGYVQIIKILLYIAGAVVIVATLIDRSPFLFLSGIGALTAVILLVFRDTILSLVASIQLTSNDMIRVGDWIEMPQFGVDGDVIDVALHTVKVQNWDKTITTVPTYKLIEGSFKNWRGMSVAGGRRIKRSLFLDLNSVHFLTPEEIRRFERFYLLKDYIARKKRELDEYNRNLNITDDTVTNARKLTNVGTFRAYVLNYLKNHPKLHQEMTLLVRQLQPTPEGLPLEIYVFTNDTEWAAYEGIQADIFDHILAIVPEFGLRVFQKPSGRDMRMLLEGAGAGARSESEG